MERQITDTNVQTEKKLTKTDLINAFFSGICLEKQR